MRDLPTPGLGELAAQIGHNASVAMLLGAFGVCVGALVRNQVVAVVGLLLIAFVVEPVLIGLVPEVFRYAPFVALPTAASAVPPEDSGLGDVDLLGPGLAVLAMLAWIAGTFAVSAVLLRARDLN